MLGLARGESVQKGRAIAVVEEGRREAVPRSQIRFRLSGHVLLVSRTWVRSPFPHQSGISQWDNIFS